MTPITKTPPNNSILPSSFRDPSGFLFEESGVLYRQINQSYKINYDLLLDSGLYQKLTANQHLIRHDEADIKLARVGAAYKIIRPEIIPFISYPYEWSFSQLKDAALLTLDIQLASLRFGMGLKDASAYNVQFLLGKPVFIDTLSFEKRVPGAPWVAYRQFCQHFLSPLALMSFVDISLNQMLRVHIDGIQLQLASRLLPSSSYLRWSLLAHIHLHAGAQRKYSGGKPAGTSRTLSERGLVGIVSSLRTAIKKLKLGRQKTEWDNYYEETNYSTSATDHKAMIVSKCLDMVKPETLWDLGANTGKFSRIASQKKIRTVSFDIDPNAVENNYLKCRTDNEPNILPLLLDLTNPSPGIGWSNNERLSIIERGPADCILALALIHHLAISNNVPLVNIAKLLSGLGNSLIIEFVSKQDSQVRRLLGTREDIFEEYNQDSFELEFKKHFSIKEIFPVKDMDRTIYLMARNT